jgi:hypothetical protein
MGFIIAGKLTTFTHHTHITHPSKHKVIIIIIGVIIEYGKCNLRAVQEINFRAPYAFSML